MLVDHHLHFLEIFKERPRCAFEEKFVLLREYLKVAKQNKIEALGFSEHTGLFDEFSDITDNPLEHKDRKFVLKEYVDLIRKLQRETDIKILMGLEVDYYPEFEKKIIDSIKRGRDTFGFDFFIGSVHWLKGTRVFGIDRNQEEYDEMMTEFGPSAFTEYFHLVNAAIATGSFNFVGHLDLIKIFGWKLSEADYAAATQETLSLLKSHSVAVEINTKGFNKPIAEQYPNQLFLRACKEHDIEVTLGSDAHFPDRVGEHFDKAINLLNELNINEIVYFEDGKLIKTECRS